MRVGNLSKAIAIAATVVWAAGCSTTSTTSDSADSMDRAEPSVDQEVAATPSAVDTEAGIRARAMEEEAQRQARAEADLAALQNVFYFDFDRAVVKPGAFDALTAHARYLINNPSARVVLEGHADERGTREYNMALGERRAQAVGRYLTVQGVPDLRVEIVSYGEERSAAVGHNEDAWSKNRRVELKYENR